MGFVSRLGILVVLLHTVAWVAHSWAHLSVPVPATTAQTLIAVLVGGLAPLVAGILIWTNRSRAGGALLLVAGAGAAWFGIANHYAIPSVDNVASILAVGDGALFHASAHALTAIELAAIAVGGCLVGQSRRA